jgi:Zn-finger nucleic acid-binding protein
MEAVMCPKCQVTMREREKGDVIIDICPQCRGVWLDAGELEKLSVRESRYYDDDDDDDFDDDRRGRFGGFDDDRREGISDYGRRRGSDGRVQSYPRKKKGFLASMMENFGGEGGDD